MSWPSTLVEWGARISNSNDRLTVPVVVLGSGITALGVVRSLGQAGLKPHLVAPAGDLSSLSRWARGRRLELPESDDPVALVTELERAGFQEAVLLACSDLWAQAVSRMSADDQARYRCSMSSSDVLDILVDKVRFAEALERFDVPHPATRLVKSSADVEVEGLDGYFLKPSHSQLFNRVYPSKAYSFENAAEAREGLRVMAEAGVDAILQEYIPGPPAAHYFVDGLVDAGGVLRAVFVRRRTRMFPIDYGNSTHMVTVPAEEADDGIADLTRLLSRIGFRGPFSAEFKRDSRDGTLKLLEVNGRPWWYIGFAAACGVDVAMLAYRDALGLELETVPGYPTGVRCVLLHLDTKAFLYERRHSGLGVFTWLRSVIGAKPTVFSWSDPLPALSLPVGIGRRRWRKAARRGGR
jgi:D-aspartate ligase